MKLQIERFDEISDISDEEMQKYKAERENGEIIRNKIEESFGFNNIIFASDQDLDGYHIRGLLAGFFKRYLPELEGSIGMLQTPVIAAKKNGKITRWSYELNSNFETKPGEVITYYKGLGSWDPEDLQYIISQDGLDKMIEIIDFNGEIGKSKLDDWLSDSKSDTRKEYLLKNEFNIASI